MILSNKRIRLCLCEQVLQESMTINEVANLSCIISRYGGKSPLLDMRRKKLTLSLSPQLLVIVSNSSSGSRTTAPKQQQQLLQGRRVFSSVKSEVRTGGANLKNTYTNIMIIPSAS